MEKDLACQYHTQISDLTCQYCGGPPYYSVGDRVLSFYRRSIAVWVYIIVTWNSRDASKGIVNLRERKAEGIVSEAGAAVWWKGIKAMLRFKVKLIRWS
jgi:hypothetical protein